MSLENAGWLTRIFLCFAMLLQAIELGRLTHFKTFQRIWSFENLKSDLIRGVPLPHKVIESLFSLRGVRTIAILQALFAGIGLLISHPAVVVVLFLTHLLICIRFRGTFNGGSDMMTFVLLTGSLIYMSSSDPKIQVLGLIYISLHAVYSYFKAGVVKVLQSDWRSGRAVPGFLERSLYSDTKILAGWFKTKPTLSLLLSWSVLIFELGIVFLFINNSWAVTYFALAVAFHFINYMSFGLNRFFWIWLATWPSIFFALSLR